MSRTSLHRPRRNRAVCHRPAAGTRLLPNPFPPRRWKVHRLYAAHPSLGSLPRLRPLLGASGPRYTRGAISRHCRVPGGPSRPGSTPPSLPSELPLLTATGRRLRPTPSERSSASRTRTGRRFPFALSLRGSGAGWPLSLRAPVTDLPSPPLPRRACRPKADHSEAPRRMSAFGGRNLGLAHSHYCPTSHPRRESPASPQLPSPPTEQPKKTPLFQNNQSSCLKPKFNQRPLF